ncbi:MAG TPA: hypothetical protein PL133_04690 [Methylophilaceae bacterium]|nr:hypothetical protein [Methylophilaceae bacterium]HQC28196.1 hypothetical protein [Methylotenera sp.]
MQVSTPVKTHTKATHSAKLKSNVPSKDTAEHQTIQPDTAKENSLTRLLASCCDCV